MDIIITQTFQLLFLAAISVFLAFCAKKKPSTGPIQPPGDAANLTKTGAVTETPTAGTTPGQTPAASVKKGEDDDDDVKFNINIKKVEEKKDEFDDDEENPLAKIPTKPRTKKGAAGAKATPAKATPAKATPAKAAPAKPATSIAAKTTVGKVLPKGMKTQEELQNPECPLLGPNEKNIGVSCYQFEPSASAGTPAPPANKKTPTPTKTEARPPKGPSILEPPVGGKSVMSMIPKNQKTKSIEQEIHTADTNENKEVEKLEKTQN